MGWVLMKDYDRPSQTQQRDLITIIVPLTLADEVRDAYPSAWAWGGPMERIYD